jgi:hypothetical protein
MNTSPPVYILRNFPSCLAILLWMARNTSKSYHNAIDSLNRFSLTWINGENIDTHPDNPSLLNGSGVLIEELALQCLKMPTFKEINHLLDVKAGKMARHWQVHAMHSEASLDSLTRKAIAAQMTEVLEDPSYIPAMNVLPLTDFLGLWFKSQGQAALLTMEWHAVLAIAIHGIISDLSQHNPERSALILNSVAGPVFEALKIMPNRLPSSVTCKHVLAV